MSSWSLSKKLACCAGMLLLFFFVGVFSGTAGTGTSATFLGIVLNGARAFPLREDVIGWASIIIRSDVLSNDAAFHRALFR